MMVKTGGGRGGFGRYMEIKLSIQTASLTASLSPPKPFV